MKWKRGINYKNTFILKAKYTGNIKIGKCCFYIKKERILLFDEKSIKRKT